MAYAQPRRTRVLPVCSRHHFCTAFAQVKTPFDHLPPPPASAFDDGGGSDNPFNRFTDDAFAQVASC